MAWAWRDQGHEIISIIAADDLSTSAREHVAKILGTASDVTSVEKAMAAASVRPETEFREEDRSTALWHFIDICLQDRRTDLSARCPDGACVTAKIDECTKRLKESDWDKWGAAGDLAFLIHLVGDVHQPLHTASDADRGRQLQYRAVSAICSKSPRRWDASVIYRLEDTVGSGSPTATAHQLEQIYAGEKNVDSWKPGEANDIAWESAQLARSEIYRALGIPIEPCEQDVNSCAHAPARLIDLDDAYMSKAATIAGQQLAKAGFRLASLLNSIWSSGSLAPSGAPSAESGASTL